MIWFSIIPGLAQRKLKKLPQSKEEVHGVDLVYGSKQEDFNGIIHKQEMLFFGNIIFLTLLNMIYLKFVLDIGLIMQLAMMAAMRASVTLMATPGRKPPSLTRSFGLKRQAPLRRRRPTLRTSLVPWPHCVAR